MEKRTKNKPCINQMCRINRCSIQKKNGNRTKKQAVFQTRYFFVENQHLLCRKELFDGGCTEENYYGYPEAKPCIMVSPTNF